jgi:signal transduction histidine kinase
MRLHYKLLSAFLLIAVLISAAGYIGVSGLGHVASAFYEVRDDQFLAHSSLMQIQSTLPIIELEASEYVNKPDMEHKEELDEAEEHIGEELIIYGQLRGEEMIGPMKSDVDELFMLSREVIRLKDEGANPEAIQQRFEELDNKLDILADRLEEEHQLHTSEMDQAGESLTRDIQSTFNLTVVLTAIAGVIAVVAGIYTSQSVSKPISRLKEAADQIGKGNFDVTTSFSKANDEIGQLCNHFGKMRDEIRNKEAMQQEFMSIASHELRTPIQPILGYADLAGRGVIKADDALKVIVPEARRLQRLANDILDVTRIEGGRLKYTMGGIHLNGLIYRVVETLKVSLNKNVTLHTKLEATEGVEIYGDQERMTQVLNNMVGNAMKFTTRGQIKIETDYRGNGKNLQIRISDTGTGIQPDLLPRLFGKFVTKNVRNENQQGTGLGLFISKAIIEAHGGSISARNNENGVGATFMITLPVHLVSDAHKEKIAESAISKKTSPV